jgi:predicted fused transcriptional regulator/phosphomethylpyrimidine kinase
VDIPGSVRAAAPPEFGSSSHLAQVLLRVRRGQPQTRAILNARYDEPVRKAIRTTGLRVRTLQRVRGELVFGAPKGAAADGVVDPGAFGVEPALYLLADSATAVVEKARRIVASLSAGDTK